MATAPAFKPTIKKQLTFPTLQMKPGVAIYFRILSPMAISTSAVVKKGQEARKPATIMQVIDRTDNVEKTIVVNKVLEGKLNEAYASQGYVGKSFAATKSSDKKKGDAGEYYDFDLAEIE